MTSESRSKAAIAGELDASRARSLLLVDPFTEEQLCRQHSRLMSPLVWDMGHVANYEELWLYRTITGKPALIPDLDGVYNPFENPRATRSSLPMLQPKEARVYMRDTRERTLEALDEVEFDNSRRILRDGYVYGMVVQHEHMHDETMLATIQLMEDGPYAHYRSSPPAVEPVEQDMVFVEGGSFEMGTDAEAWVFDNERPRHVVDVDGFFIDRVPVTNGAYLAFVQDGGYDDPRHWSADGWAHRQESGLASPQFWVGEGSSWGVRRFGHLEPLRPDEPVQHVCYWEADAFARWAGKRLPTEPEWEKAASWGPDGRKRRYPWGDSVPTPALCNLGQRHFGPSAAGAYPAGASAYGCHQMLGDVWEWTATDFDGYPGFESFPYQEYSEVFYGDEYKVLRGGSWATHESAIRNTFRNWDYPIRRQIFAGFRCAKSA